MKLAKEELDELREVIRQSIGDNADEFTDQDLCDFGISLLEATATILKAKRN
jgi:hypothetical protein